VPCGANADRVQFALLPFSESVCQRPKRMHPQMILVQILHASNSIHMQSQDATQNWQDPAWGCFLAEYGGLWVPVPHSHPIQPCHENCTTTLTCMPAADRSHAHTGTNCMCSFIQSLKAKHHLHRWTYFPKGCPDPKKSILGTFSASISHTSMTPSGVRMSSDFCNSSHVHGLSSDHK